MAFRVVFALWASVALGAGPRGKAVDGQERLLYVTDKSGLSVYDIIDSHKSLRQIAMPDTAAHKGISASVPGGLLLTSMPPKHLADVALFQDPSEQPHPGWVSFSIDGDFAYPDGGAVIDTKTKPVVARFPTSEKLIEIDFRDGKPVKAGHR